MNKTLEDLDLSVRTYNAVKRYGITTVDELSERIDEFCGHAPKFGAEAREAIEKLGSAPVQSTAQVLSADYTKAVSLTRRIKANALAAQESLWEVCKDLMEVRNGKLYKELGYQNFDTYCKSEVGLTPQQGRKYAAIAELDQGENGKSTFAFETIGTEKLYLLARLDEPQREQIQQNVDVESVSVKELKRQITDLESKLDSVTADRDQEKDLRKEMEEKNYGYKQRQDKLLARNKELVSQLECSEEKCEKFEADLDEANDTIHDLGKQLEELESQPRDSYEDTTRISELEKRLAELETENAAKLTRLRAEYESKEAGEPQVCKAVFQAYLTSAADALHRLCDFAEEHKPAEEFSYYLSRITKLIRHAESEAKRIGG